MRALFCRVWMTVLFFACISGLSACRNADPGPLEGKWGYIHDPSTVILEGNGDRLTYEGKKYSFTADQDFLYLKRGTEEQTLRYRIIGNHTYIYRTTDYTLTTEAEEETLVGVWENKANKWSFEFTENGEFLEDGFFPGTYSVSDNGTFKLMYTDHFEDTECYYSINGRILTVEYPWEIVKTEDTSQE